MDGEFTEFREASKNLTEGARLLVVEPLLPQDQAALGRLPMALARRNAAAFHHMPALAVIDRGAFIPYLFTGWTPVRVASRNEALFQSMGEPLDPKALAEAAAPPYARDWPRHFDFVVWIDFGHPPATLPSALLPWSAGSFFHIYRVVAEGAAGPASSLSTVH